MLLETHAIRTRLTIAVIGMVSVIFIIAGLILLEHRRVMRDYETNMRDIIAEYRVASATEALVKAYSAYVQNSEDRQLRTELEEKRAGLEDLISRISVRSMNSDTYVAFIGLRNTAYHIRDRSVEGVRAMDSHNVARTEQIYDELSRKQDYIYGNTAALIMKELEAAAYEQELVYKRNVQRYVVLSLALLGVMGGVIVFTISVTRRLTGPVMELTAISQTIATGRIDVEVPVSLMKRHDEVGSLAVAFDMMLRNLKQKIDQMNREVEERKRAERKAEDASEYKSLFLANMSHELRTPMNAIIGFSGLLQSADFKGEEKMYMDGIRRSAKALQGIVNDVLDFSKIEAGRMQLENAPFRLQEIIDSAVSVVSYQAQEKGLVLRKKLDEGFPEWAWGDANRFSQILLNLLNNAVKFTPSGFVELSGRIKSRNDELFRIVFSVKDSGIGIEDDQLEAIMTPFAQADVSHTRQYGGTGLGLSICKSLCELMGSTLKVESEPGKGSTFSFTIDLKTLGDDSRIVRRINKEVKDTQSLSSFRILVADDDATNQMVTRAILRSVGYGCDIVSNGVEVLDALKEKEYDVIFMDVQMPLMDGIEATERIRENPDHKRFPWIIALTANATCEDRKACIDAGMNDYLAKPVENEMIRHALMNVELAV